MQIPNALPKLLAGIGFITVATFAQAQMTGPNSMRDATKLPAIPEGKETDIKLYGAKGSGVVMGMPALEQMPKAGVELQRSPERLAMKSKATRVSQSSCGLLRDQL